MYQLFMISVNGRLLTTPIMIYEPISLGAHFCLRLRKPLRAKKLAFFNNNNICFSVVIGISPLALLQFSNSILCHERKSDHH